MTFRWHVLLALAACAAPVSTAPATPPAARRALPAMPRALSDGADVRIRARVRVSSRGAIRFERGAAPLDVDRGSDPVLPEDAALVVADQEAGRVLARVDGDDARLLVWIDRDDLAPVFVKAHALVDPATGLRVAVARPGAFARVLGVRGGDRHVAILDGALAVEGDAPASVIGTVYDARPPRAATIDATLPAGEDVVASPDGPRIAQAVLPVDVHELAPPDGGWVEIEIDRPVLYVRGYVRDASLVPSQHAPPLPHDSALEADDLPTLLLPAGACLYARPGGPIVGVNEAERLRYARDGGAPGWRGVGVMTAWGLVWAAAHFPEANGAPSGDYDRCLTRRASRSR